MTLAAIEEICTKCSAKFNAIPEKSFLGFQKIECPSCNETITYPLAAGYRKTYWVILALMIVEVLMGNFVYSIFGAGLLFLLLKDRGIQKKSPNIIQIPIQIDIPKQHLTLEQKSLKAVDITIYVVFFIVGSVLSKILVVGGGSGQNPIWIFIPMAIYRAARIKFNILIATIITVL